MRRHPLLRGTLVTALGTLASRVLGMLRDTATAALLGLAGGGVADAFFTAFRLPNLFRRMFGEGALSASYLPVFAAQYEKGPQHAWRLASVLFTWLVLLLSGLVLLGEAVLGLSYLIWGGLPGVPLLLSLAAVMLPYMMLVCLAAQIGATLHARTHFAVPALTPVVLNLCWLAAAWLVAPRVASDRAMQAHVLAGAIVLAGVLQVAVQVPTLRRLGFRYDYDLAAAWEPMKLIALNMLPMLFGLAVTQINTFIDSLIAWGLARAPDGPDRIAWLGGAVRYPLAQGAAAAVYYGERLYEFPLGILGLAVATAIFPLLSRHAARGDRKLLGADLSLGLRLVIFLGLPAAAGLMVLAEPLVRLLFERGEFTAGDTARTARITACYAAGVWAYCASPVVVRGFYAIGDTRTPVRVAACMVAMNLSLNLLLIWPLAEAGLAVSTALCAIVQCAALTWLFARRGAPLDWAPLMLATARALAATLVMAVAAAWMLSHIEPSPEIVGKLLRALVPACCGAAVYCGVYRLLGGRELGMLLSGQAGAHSPYDAD